MTASITSATLQYQLQTAESEFLTAIVNGDDALQVFADSLEKLQRRTLASISQNHQDVETSRIASKVSGNIATIAQGILDMEVMQINIGNELMDGLASIFGGCSLDIDATSNNVEASALHQSCSADKLVTSTSRSSLPSTSMTSASRTKSTTKSIKRRQSPMDVSTDLTYQQDYKCQIARRFNISTKAVEDWFVQIRKRIGWTAIRKQYFNGDAFLAINYARSVLADTSRPESSSNSSSNLHEELFKMKDAAEHLYDGKFHESDLARTTATNVDTPASYPSAHTPGIASSRGSSDSEVCPHHPRKRRRVANSGIETVSRSPKGLLGSTGTHESSSDRDASVKGRSSVTETSRSLCPRGRQNRKRPRPTNSDDSSSEVARSTQIAKRCRRRASPTSDASCASAGSSKETESPTISYSRRSSASESGASTPEPSSPLERTQELSTPFINTFPGYDYSDFYSNAALHDWTLSVRVDPLQDVQSYVVGYMPTPPPHAREPKPTAPPTSNTTLDFPLSDTLPSPLSSNMTQAALDEILSGLDFSIPEGTLFGFGEGLDVPGGDLEFSTADFSQILNMDLNAPISTSTTGTTRASAASSVTDSFLDPTDAFSSTKAMLNAGFFDNESASSRATGPSVVDTIVPQSAVIPSISSAMLTAPVA